MPGRRAVLRAGWRKRCPAVLAGGVPGSITGGTGGDSGRGADSPSRTVEPGSSMTFMEWYNTLEKPAWTPQPATI
ncbi:MAG: hypothetical protein ACKOJF_34240, partial [Planctomycetaceae bacterium]